LQASTVASAEEKFGIDEYSDVIMLTKPVIYISVKEICSTHSVSLFLMTFWYRVGIRHCTAYYVCARTR
jgi:hypothetical protein